MNTPTRPSALHAPDPDQSDREHPNNKRSRGRPPGSSQFADEDRATLEKIADALVREPDLKPTAVMRRLGYGSEAEIRRLQSKWRKDKESLLADAQRRLDAQPPETTLDAIVNIIAELAGFAGALATAPAVQSLKESLDRQVRRHIAQDELGVSPRSPTEPGNQKNLERAIERFEARPHQSLEDLKADIPETMTVDEMPPSLRLYAMALMLHEMALDAKQREATAAQSAGGDGRDDNRNAGNNERGKKA